MGHHHNHHHGHSHSHGHSHDHGSDLSGRRLSLAIVINVILTIVQITAGLVSGSLALVADGLHNFSDAGSLVVAFVARKIAGLPSTKTMTYGYGRAEILGALINSVSLVVVAIYLLYEAITRFGNADEISAPTVIAVAFVALIIDLLTAWLTYKGSESNINMRAAFIHNVSDALASVVVIISGVIIYFYDAFWIDLVATILISIYIIYHSWGLISSCIKTLMQAVPEEIKVDQIRTALCHLEAVKDVHHIHVWQIHERFRSLEAHIVLEEMDFEQLEAIKSEIKSCLKNDFGINHSTLEFEFGNISCK